MRKTMFTLALAVFAVLGTGAVAGAGTVPAGAAVAPARVIAFDRGTATSQPSVWVANGAAAPVELGPGYGPLVAPNGAAVAASSTSGSAIVVYPVAGGAPKTFAVHGATVRPLAWSPDSRYLAVELYGTAVKGIGNSSLALLDTTAGMLRTVRKGVVSGAGFAPSGTDRVVFGVAPGLTYNSPQNLFVASAAGGPVTQLTHDGRSLLPVWGAKGIAYDRETLRGQDEAPAFQVMLRNGSRVTQLTHMKVPALLSGLAPMEFSANGNRLWCQYGGEDTDFAETIQITPRIVKPVVIKGQYVQGGGISADGSTLLVVTGGFMAPPSDGTVQTIPFGGGGPTPLFKGAQPNWNG